MQMYSFAKKVSCDSNTSDCLRGSEEMYEVHSMTKTDVFKMTAA